MGSHLDPYSDFPTPRPNNVVQPLDPSILTQPVWINLFLTPGAAIPTRVPVTRTAPPPAITPTQVASATPTAQATASPTNTKASFLATPTGTSLPVSSKSPKITFTATALPSADLMITKSNNVLVYSPGGTLTYTVVVANDGPNHVSGAVLSDPIQPQIASWSWACNSQNGGASGCDTANNTGDNFTDKIDLPAGASVVYTVTANIRNDADGTLANTAYVQGPVDVPDPVPGNNSATDMDDISHSLPYGSIGTNPDNSWNIQPPGSSLTLAFDAPLMVGSHPGWDIVMYELANGSGIAMDLITLQIGDGSNWYTVFNWGDNVPDRNTNLDIGVLGGIERDNRAFDTIPESDILYPFNSGTDASPATGIVIDLDGVVPNGTYLYFRVLSPGGDMDGGCEIDAIAVLP